MKVPQWCLVVLRVGKMGIELKSKILERNEMKLMKRGNRDKKQKIRKINKQKEDE
jgi:hypothetical protein